MPKTLEPSIRQQTAFKKTLENIAENKPVVMGDIMIESGFSKATAKNPVKNLTSKAGWQDLLARYDDKPILDLIYQEALDRRDKRNATANRDILLKLKDRYPAQKSKVIGLFGGLSDLEEKTEPQNAL